MLETSVWKRMSIVDRSKLLDGKYFNIFDIENLYVKLQVNLLQKIIRDYKIAKLSKPSNFLHKKIVGNHSISLKALAEILSKTKGWDKIDIIKFLERNMCLFACYESGRRPNWIRLPLSYHPKLEIIFRYLQSYNDNIRILVHQNPALIKRMLDANIRKQGSSYVFSSKVLNTFIKKFVSYKKDYKINLNIEKSIDFSNVDLLRGIFIPLVVTDGSHFLLKDKYHYIEFFSGPTNKFIQDIFVYSAYKLLRKYPTSYAVLNKEGNLIKTRFILDRNNYMKIIKEVKSFKTSPANNQSVAKYIREPQPSIKYLDRCNRETQKYAIRVWFSTEGCVSINRSRLGQYIRPALSLACAHPILVSQLQKLLKKFGIDMGIQKDSRRWHGIGGLSTRNHKSVENFYRIGGFLPNVYIAGNSTYYRGIEKQKLLCTILNVCRERQDCFKNMPIENIHKKLSLIARGFAN